MNLKKVNRSINTRMAVVNTGRVGSTLRMPVESCHSCRIRF